MSSDRAILTRLLALEGRIDTRLFFAGEVPEAVDLTLSDPYAFCLSTCLDRGMKAEVVWTIPYWLKQRLGHLDPQLVYLLSEERLAGLIAGLPKRPRYMDAAPRTVREITAVVVEEYDGDASRIWTGRRAADVKATFLSVYGVGQGIANMAVLLIERVFGVRFSDLDRKSMDIKPDVHTMRVLARLGVAPEQSPYSAIAAARRLSPDYPGEIDAPLWLIGRTWCTAEAALCDACPLGELCPRVSLGG